MKYRYAIVDLEDYSVVRCADDDNEEIRTALYKFRKDRYIAEHPGRPSWEYDKLRHDNGYNLIKYAVIA